MEIVVIGLIVLLLARRNQPKPPVNHDLPLPSEKFPLPIEKYPQDFFVK